MQMRERELNMIGVPDKGRGTLGQSVLSICMELVRY